MIIPDASKNVITSHCLRFVQHGTGKADNEDTALIVNQINHGNVLANNSF